MDPGGSLVLRIEGQLREHPSSTTVQIDTDAHIDVDQELGVLQQMDRYPWRFMNHACDPNTLIRLREIIAVRHIRPGEELTFNYNTTEYDMDQPFVCRCGSLFCEGTIRGFRYLAPAQRERLLPLLAPHLAALAGAGPRPAHEP